PTNRLFVVGCDSPGCPTLLAGATRFLVFFHYTPQWHQRHSRCRLCASLSGRQWLSFFATTQSNLNQIPTGALSHKDSQWASEDLEFRQGNHGRDACRRHSSCCPPTPRIPSI